MLTIIDISRKDYDLMRKAFDEASCCDASDSAFSVGSIVTTMDREILSTGYSREFGPDWHAEEVAIEKACRKITSLDNCILYSTLEPCGERASRPISCSEQEYSSCGFCCQRTRFARRRTKGRLLACDQRRTSIQACRFQERL